MKKLDSIWKKMILIMVDVTLINLAVILAYYFRYDYGVFKSKISSYFQFALVITCIYIAVFALFKLYESLWSYVSIEEFLLLVGAVIMGSTLNEVYLIITDKEFTLSILILSSILIFLFISSFRISFRFYRRASVRVNNKHRKRTLIVGAGSAAVMLIKDMKTNKDSPYKAVGLIDDNILKVDRRICGVKVYGSRKDILMISKKLKVDVILIAIASLDKENKSDILKICKETECEVKLVPNLYEIIDGKISVNNVRDVSVDDLLGREEVKLDISGIERYISNKVVLVTGGGGSIGSELCRQISKVSPSKLIIIDIYENNAYDLQNELKYKYSNLDMEVLIASVRDRKRIENIFKTYRPNIVFHAAAHKHVPLMEVSPMEAIKNNVFGTLNVAETSDKFGCEKFVLISTDKAVNPTNIMGATKRICEMIIQALDKKSKTKFVAVRFGNVLGSNGSVIPLFKKQIQRGGPVTVTHREINRFFMTIPEAAKLVLQAGAYAGGGEIFVLDMGKPVKIYDLAYDLIQLSGLTPNKDIKIDITGLRPGEKLFEELLMNEEGLKNTKHRKIFIAKPGSHDLDKLKARFNELQRIIEKDDCNELAYKIQEIVPTYIKEGQVEVAATVQKDC